MWKQGLSSEAIKEIENAVADLPEQDREKTCQILAELRRSREACEKWDKDNPLPELEEFVD